MLKGMLGEVLKESAAHGRLANPTLSLLQTVWPTLVGEELAERTWPLEWREGVLDVGVGSEAWRQELERHAQSLVQRVNKLLPWTVTALHFVVDATAESKPPTNQTRPTSTSTEASVPVPDVVVEAGDEGMLEGLDGEAREQVLRIREYVRRQSKT